MDELARRIAGLLIVGFWGQRLADAPWVRTAIAKQGLGGVILFDKDQLTGRPRNVASAAQVLALSTDLRNAAGTHGLLIGVDQEGGIVSRFTPAHGFPALASQATVGQGTAAAARAWARTLTEAAPLAQRATKEVAWRTADMGWVESVRFGETMRKVAAATDDVAEGLRAWREKRRPEWRGR